MKIEFPTGRFIRPALHRATTIGGSLPPLRSALLVLLACGMLAGTLHAQTTYTYSTTGGDEWTIPGNWTGGVFGHFPGDGNGAVANAGTATDIAAFGAIGNAAASLGIDFNSLNGSLTLGAIQLLSSANQLVHSIGNSSSAAGQTSATLALTGQTINGIANTILSNESSRRLTLQPRQNGNAAASFNMSIALASGTDNVIQINGSGDIFVVTSISGTGSNLIIDGSGAGVVRLATAASNTYSGITTIRHGTLDLGSTAIAIAGDIVIGDGSGPALLRLLNGTNGNQIADTSFLTFNGTGANAGTFQVHPSRTDTVGGLVSTGGAGVVESYAAGTAFLSVNVDNTPRDFSGILQNGSAGALAFTKSGNAAQTLSGTVANTYTGKTLVNSGTLILNKTDGVTA
ncbi:MAG: autotransporter-associated beta strand repeat-containing protein, partial [Chthoniobacterales bacterium]